MSDAAPAGNGKWLDRLTMLLRGEVAPPPIAQLIGFTLTSIEPGQAKVSFEAGERADILQRETAFLQRGDDILFREDGIVALALHQAKRGLQLR